MPRSKSPDSVSTKVAELKEDQSITFQNPYTSVMVMVSLLRKKPEHRDKIFKIHVVNNATTVTRRK
jgi:hypothetical protein